MFLGEYQHTLDPKGRLILPADFRDELGEGLVISVGLDNCLALHPQQEWLRILEELRQLRTTDARERGFVRMLYSSAHEQVPDKQGRITVPGHLRRYASLSKDVTIVGVDVRIEIWDSDRWQRYRGERLADFANTNEAFDIGIF